MAFTPKLLQQGSAGGGPKNYIEDVFSTYLYTGTGATQTITNGIDLSAKGGLVWIKDRSNAESHSIWDTARGVSAGLQSNATSAQYSDAISLTAYNSNGFSLGADSNVGWVNRSPDKYVSWTFRKQPKFFDVVTFTKSSSPQTISHNLGSTPGCIFIKRTDSTGAWLVAHRGYSGGITAGYTVLNTTAAFTSDANAVTAADSTSFTLGSSVVSGDFVAYLFAHDAGGFGLTGTDNVISCGSFTTDGSGNATVNLGYEPQWIMYKSSSTAGGDWQIFDSMRALTTSLDSSLSANSSGAETTNIDWLTPSATGFSTVGAGFYANATYIYIAIRRGPMKVPTVGTSVFGLSARTGTGANATVTGGQTDDAVLIKNRGSAIASLFSSRLTGTGYVITSSTAAEASANTTILQANPWDVMDGVKVGTTSTITNASASTFINYLFKRAPSFFDEVCYTGTGSNTTFTHNLTVVPELMIVKKRSSTNNWVVWQTNFGTGLYGLLELYLNLTFSPPNDGGAFLNTPTSTVFSVSTYGATNGSGATYVAYLFATCAGVSKVGSYTGTGTTLQINCGFTGGARFVLIKRTDDTGDWYVWDSARGIVAGDDPYLLLNSAAAEVTNTDYIDTYSAGFELSSTAPAAINYSGGTFIFLAIA